MTYDSKWRFSKLGNNSVNFGSERPELRLGRPELWLGRSELSLNGLN